jgi:pimeloyl-ACP methyl ester carboxylesterase
MPYLTRDAASIYYEDHGRGFPMLLIAPGGMHSTVEMWSRAAIDPLEALRGDLRLVAMDQRNAGRSTGPLEVDDPWGSFAADQLALMDHLDIEQFAVMGCCIGGSYALKLVDLAPERVAAAVLQQPIGIEATNGHLFDAMWRGWAEQLGATRPDLDPRTLERFGTRMWDGDFVVSVTREAVRRSATPILVLPGVDQYHPTATGREIAALAPRGELVEPWKGDAQQVAAATAAVRAFLRRHAARRPTG